LLSTIRRLDLRGIVRVESRHGIFRLRQIRHQVPGRAAPAPCSLR